MQWCVHRARRPENNQLTISSAERSSCVFPRSLSITAPDLQSPPTCRRRARRRSETHDPFGAGISATRRSGPPIAGDDDEGSTLLRHPDKADRASIRRKGRANIVSRVRGQPHGRRRANQLDVDIEVVLLLPVPGKSHLIAVRRKARRAFKTRISGQWDHFRCGSRFPGSPAKEPSGHSYGHDNESLLPPKARSAEPAEPRVVSRPASPSPIPLSVPPASPSDLACACQRRYGSFRRQRLMIFSRSRGIPGTSWLMGLGS